MSDSIEDRLEAMGLELPKAAAPVASYAPVRVHQGIVYVSGQLPFRGGALVTGRLGEDIDIDRGAAAARLCGLMILAQVKAALGDLARIEQVLKLGVFVASTPSFTDQPKVANGASELFEALLGEKGVHARAAVGVAALPLGAAVEVDAVIACR